jgi:hypothetical protein
MFGRNFHLDDVMMLWDAIFAQVFTCGGWIEMIEYLSVAMIMYIRGDLLQKQAHHALQRLMKCVCCLSSPIMPSYIIFIQVSTGRICQHVC